MQPRGNGKLKVFLADLTHTGIRIANEAFPLNVGLVGSYALKRFGREIEVRLFKFPEKLLQALQEEGCDVLGCSTYVWNNNLGEWAFEVAKRLNPNVVTVRGGPNFPLEPEQQESYFRKNRFTDIYCLYEGELPFAAMLERLLGTGPSGWNNAPIDGCVFLDRRDGGILQTGAPLPRLKDLDEIPSPYTTGLLDEFFDGDLTPMIATTRGCPFTCNYCNAGNGLYNHVNFFSQEYVLAEIDYIAKRISRYGITNLTIGDNNFGMYERDKAFALALQETQRTLNWPLSIIACTGKNNVDRIMKTTEELGDALTMSMSVQSMDTNTLKLIERDNIRLDMYGDIARALEEKGRSRIAEVIVPLPAETFEGYLNGIEKLINLGASAVISYTLALSSGTVYTGRNFRDTYGYRGKYRLIPNDFGTYGGKKVFDYEEVATFSSSLSFEQYLEIRKFALVTELLFNNSILVELTKLLREKGLPIFSLMKEVLQSLPEASAPVREVFASFCRETTSELKETEEELVSFYSEDENYRQAEKGEAGGNIIYRHKGMMLVRHMNEWVNYTVTCARKVVQEANGEADPALVAPMFEDVSRFMAGKLAGLFEHERTGEVLEEDFRYDIVAWLESAESSPLDQFEGSFRFRFRYTDEQIVERNDLFSRYTTDTSGLSKIMARLMSLDRIFRKVERVR